MLLLKFAELRFAQNLKGVIITNIVRVECGLVGVSVSIFT